MFVLLTNLINCKKRNDPVSVKVVVMALHGIPPEYVSGVEIPKQVLNCVDVPTLPVIGDWGSLQSQSGAEVLKNC